MIKNSSEFTVFVLVGITCTAIHGLILLGLVEYMQIFPSFSNGIAFIAANIASYVFNSKFTFKKELNVLGYLRYFQASIFAFIFTILIFSLLESIGFNYIIIFIITTLTTPLISFNLVKYFGYVR